MMRIALSIAAIGIFLFGIAARAQTVVWSLDNIQMIDGSHYACSNTGITAALTALPSTGGIVDARGCEGSMTWNANVTVGTSTKPETLLLGYVTITMNGQLIVNGSASHVFGISQGTIFLQGTLPASTPVLQIGTNAIVSAATIDEAQINCDNAASSIGFENLYGQEQSGFFNMTVENCTKYGGWYESSNAQNSSGGHWTILPSGGGAGTIGVYIHNVVSFRGLRDVTLNTNDAMTIGNALVLDGVKGGSFTDFHIEHATVGVDVGPTTYVGGAELANIYGNTSVPTLVKVEATGNLVVVKDLWANGGATTLNNASPSYTDTSGYVPLCLINAKISCFPQSGGLVTVP